MGRRPKPTAFDIATKKDTFDVYGLDDFKLEFLTAFGPNPNPTEKSWPEDAYRHYSLDEVVAELVEHFGVRGARDDNSYDAMEMVVCKDDRILAVVRRGPDGRPQVTTFAD